MNALAVLGLLFTLIFQYSVRVGLTHFVANGLIYEDFPWTAALKIHLFEFGLNLLLWFVVYTLYAGFGALSPMVGGMVAGLLALLAPFIVLWEIIKFTAKTYETSTTQGAIIYILSVAVAAMFLIFVNAVFRFSLFTFL